MTARLLGDLTPLQKLSLIDMSYSRLSTYDSCAAKYFYTYCLREPQQFGTHAALGSTVHSVLENVDFTEPFDLLDLHKSFNLFLPKHDPEGLIPEDLINVGHAILNDFVDRHEDDTFNVIGVEVPFAIVIGRGLICGYIDRVDDEGVYIRVIDYKTGKYPITYKSTPTNLQTGIYALAMKALYPHKAIKTTLYYLRTGDTRNHTYTDEDLDLMEELIAEKIDAVIADINLLHTANPYNCRFCDHGVSGTCKLGAGRREDLHF